jgi:hypothetical protein
MYASLCAQIGPIKSWSLEIQILLEQKQVLGIVNSTETAPDTKDITEFNAFKKQH